MPNLYNPSSPRKKPKYYMNTYSRLGVLMAYVISNGIPIIMSTIFWFVDDIQEGYMDDLHTVLASAILVVILQILFFFDYLKWRTK